MRFSGTPASKCLMMPKDLQPHTAFSEAVVAWLDAHRAMCNTVSSGALGHQETAVTVPEFCRSSIRLLRASLLCGSLGFVNKAPLWKSPKP